MNPASRSSNRGTKLKNQQYNIENEIFNNSFYQEKLSAENYSSLEYVKKYLKESNLSFVIEKVMGIVLHLQNLPENPYNLMYRLIHHEAIYQNLRRFYNQDREFENMINYNIEQQQHDFQSRQDIKQHADSFVSIFIKDKEVFVSDKLKSYLHPINLYIFYKIVYSKQIIDRNKVLAEKFNFQSINVSYGGPIVINLRGNLGNFDISSKLPKQQADKSIYSGESMLTCTLYVQSNRDMSKCMQEFVELVMEDIIETIQYKDENYTSFFQKLQFFNIDETFNLLEFSREQIINSNILVQKEIIKFMDKENMTLRIKCVYRLSKDLSLVVGQQFITVHKQYILVAQVENQLSFLCNSSLKFAFKQVFINKQTLNKIFEQEHYQAKDIFLEYKAEMIFYLIGHLKNQNLTFLIWEVFYYLVYQNRQSAENEQFIEQLNKTISYILLSPISFVYRLIYTLKCVKWLTLPTFPSQNQNQTYGLIINMEHEITAFIQKGNYIYWQLQIFYEAIKRLLSIIVEFKQLKLSSILFIVDHALIMLNGVTINFNQILIVLQGNILSYLNLLRENLMRDHQNTSQEEIVSYDLFIKQKELPTRVLKLNDEVKKIKKQLNLVDNEVKMIILSKYISKFKLYEKIYQFYWQIFIGKKIIYPLSKFLKVLMINSTQCSYDIYKSNYIQPKHKIDVNKVNDISIYEINNPQTSYIFYSLNPDVLQIYTLKQYKTVIDIIKPFLEQQDDSKADLGFRYGSKTSIEDPLNQSHKQKGKNKILISVKSIQISESVGNQISSFNQCKLLLDVILHRNYNNKSDLYGYIADYLYELMDRLDRQNYSVLGIFPYNENQSNILHNDEYIYTKLQNDDNSLKFDYKQKFNHDKFTKFIDNNIMQGKFIEVKIIYKIRDIIKIMKLSFNFYYKNTSKSDYFSIFKANYISQRIFQSKKNLLTWCQLNQPKYIKQQLSNIQPNKSKNEMLSSLKKLHEQKQISILEILSQKQVEQIAKDSKKPISKYRYYKQSLFYNLLQRSLELIQNLQILIQYLKTDRRGRYDLSHIRKVSQLLKYYLIDRCLVKDDYIYSQGVSVAIVNLMTFVKQYLNAHPDNNGEQRELLYLERIITKIAGLVKFEQISCTLCIHESLNINQDQISVPS